MSPYLATPPIVAALVWDVLPKGLQETVCATDLVSPCYRRLPMGGQNDPKGSTEGAAASGRKKCHFPVHACVWPGKQ